MPLLELKSIIVSTDMNISNKLEIFDLGPILLSINGFKFSIVVPE